VHPGKSVTYVCAGGLGNVQHIDVLLKHQGKMRGALRCRTKDRTQEKDRRAQESFD
jgi:hypothetical protein